MIKGIGVDAVCISELKDMIIGLGNIKSGTDLSCTETICADLSGIRKMFTETEIQSANDRIDPYEYLAARYAGKEAVFKAIPGEFDYRKVEILNADDGSPYVNKDPYITSIMEKAGIENVQISITTEQNMAIAFVVAQ